MPMTKLACDAINALIYRITWGGSQNFLGARWVERIVSSYRASVRESVSVLVNGRTLRKGWRDNGHLGHSAAFWQAVRGMPTGVTLGAMRATIQAADRARAL
jgi:hypothetical protein